MILLGQKRYTMNPPVGTQIAWGHPLATSLKSALLCHGALSAPDFVTRFITGPGSVRPTLEAHARFGIGWRNNATTNKWILFGPARGFYQGLSKFSFLVLCHVIAVPAAGFQMGYAYESVADTDGSTRVGAFLTNGSLGSTGLKWDFSFRTGTGASTRRDVNAAAGGTTVAANTSYAVGGTFNSDADVYQLYVNGYLEASLSVAESAIAATNPNVQPHLLVGGGSDEANGVVHGHYIWNRVLTPGEFNWLNAEPYAFLRPQNPRLRYFFPSVAAAGAGDVKAFTTGHHRLIGRSMGRGVWRV